MKTVIWGRGFVGEALVRELSVRGHDVTAVSRHPGPALPEGVRTATASVHDPAAVTRLTADADVIISALPAVDTDGELALSVAVLLEAAEESGARLGIVGGSAALPLTAGGPPQADTADLPAWLAERAGAHGRVLALLRTAPAGADWFCVVPAVEFGPHAPGIRTNFYRTSTTALVTDEKGRSVIGVEDYAIAFADEVENPTAHRSWVAVGY